MTSDEKRYDPRDTTLKFVNRPDDLDPREWQLEFCPVGVSKAVFPFHAAMFDMMQYQKRETCV